MPQDGFAQAEDLAKKLQGALGGLQGQFGNLGGAGGALGTVGTVLPYLGIAALLFWLSRKSGGPTLEAQRFEIAENPRPGQPLISCQGRGGGLLGGALARLGVVPTATWSAGSEGVRRETTGLFGRSCQSIPAEKLASCGFSASRSPMPLAVAVALLFSAAALGGWIGLAAVFGAVYAAWSFWRSQRFVFEAESQGGTRLAIALARDALGRTALHAESAQQAFRLLEGIVRGGRANARAAPGAEDTVPLADEPRGRHATPASPVREPPSIPLAAELPKRSVFQSEPAAPERPRRPRLAPAAEPAPPPARHLDETAAQEAYAAARRLFDEGRKPEALASWQALIRRWPETRSAVRARRLLDNRSRRSRPQ